MALRVPCGCNSDSRETTKSETMIVTTITGILYKDPEQKTAKNGNPYTAAVLRAADSTGTSRYVSVIAYDADVRATLNQTGKGEGISLCGPLGFSAYLNKDGEPAPGISMQATGIMTARKPTSKATSGTSKAPGFAPKPAPKVPTKPAAQTMTTTGTNCPAEAGASGFDDMDNDCPF